MAGDANIAAVQRGSKKLMRRGKVLGQVSRGLRRVSKSFEAVGTATEFREAMSGKQKAAAGAGVGAVGVGAAYGGRKLRRGVINRGGIVDDMGNQVAVKGMYKRAGKSAVDEAKAAAAKAGKRVKRKGLKGVARLRRAAKAFDAA